MRSGTCRMLKFSTNVSVPFFIHAVSGWAFHKLKQNEQNINMCIVANRSFYTILFDMEK